MEPIHTHRGFTPALTVPPCGARRIPTVQLVSGFTLIELMVVFAIIITITGVVFTSQSTFNKTLILANTAYDVALTLRSAETYGLGSRVISGSSNTGYGIHFDKGTSTFILFEDKFPTIISGGPFCHTSQSSQSGYSSGPDAQPGNCKYDSGEDVKTYTLGNNITVDALYAGNTPVDSLDVVFARPNPDPSVRANGSTAPVYNSACIALLSQGGMRFVRVISSGQITTNTTSCP